jgi:mannose-6-phosphate isomerase-like protein (cupin superfamily)
MSDLAVINLSKAANEIEQPFALLDLVLVGELSVHLYICQGQLGWHKHLDEDELFLVHEGVIQLESELGEVTLHPDECAVVPKGIAHRSGSALRSVVLLVRTATLAERKNGHRRLHGTSDEPRLQKARLSRPPSEMPPDFEPGRVAGLEGYEVSLQRAQGVGPRATAPVGGALLLALRGAVSIEMEEGSARLEPGELTVVPEGSLYTLTALEAALLAKLQKEEMRKQ